MILEKDWKTVCDTIEKFYKNRELVVYTLNIENRCVDVGLYDSRTRNEKNVARSLLIRKSLYDNLTKYKNKYNISYNKILNIAIHDALLEEGIIKK